MEAFVADVKQILASSRDPLVQAQGVADHMKDLLAAPIRPAGNAGLGWGRQRLTSPF